MSDKKLYMNWFFYYVPCGIPIGSRIAGEKDEVDQSWMKNFFPISKCASKSP